MNQDVNITTIAKSAEADTAQERPAQGCVSSNFTIQTRLEECGRLDPEVLTKARVLDMTHGPNEKAWADILPLLDREQVLRSQRGELRALGKTAGLEGFSMWWDRFCRDNEIGIALRTVQHRLRSYRSRNAAKKGTREREPRLTPAQQRRLAVAVLLAYQIVEAIQKGGDVAGAVEDFLRGAPPPNNVEEMLRKVLDDAESAASMVDLHRRLGEAGSREPIPPHRVER